MTRQLIVVDCEATGLSADAHILEIAAINVTTNEELYFVPFTPSLVWTEASPEALAINRFFERRVWEHMLGTGDTNEQWIKLADMLQGNTFGGSNPRFDAELVQRRLVNYSLPTGWHHRLADVSAYACGALGLDPAEPPGLADICKQLNIPAPDHSAYGDAVATVECFRKLRRRE